MLISAGVLKCTASCWPSREHEEEDEEALPPPSLAPLPHIRSRAVHPPACALRSRPPGPPSVSLFLSLLFCDFLWNERGGCFAVIPLLGYDHRDAPNNRQQVREKTHRPPLARSVIPRRTRCIPHPPVLSFSRVTPSNHDNTLSLPPVVQCAPPLSLRWRIRENKHKHTHVDRGRHQGSC